MEASTKLVKIAMRREEGYPIGTPAPLYLLCPCGHKLPVEFGVNCKCACGAEYTYDGWKLK